MTPPVAAPSATEVIFTASREPMWLWDPDTLRILDANAAAAAALGWTPAELQRMTLTELQVDANPRRLRSGDYAGDWRHRRRDGSIAWMHVTTEAVTHHGAEARLSFARDLTVERESEARTKAIVDTAADAILTIDLDGLVESVNLAAEQMFGRPAAAIVGGPVGDVIRATDGRPIAGPAFAHGRDVLGVRRDGSTFPLELAVTAVELGARTVSTVIARDVSERRALETRLTSQTTHDSLTGLPNRLLFVDRLAHALSLAARNGDAVGVLFCDLDRFKVVNDSLGHTAGDALLYGVAGRLRDAVRTADTVARFGGDEFVVLVEQVADSGEVLRVAGKLEGALTSPLRVGTDDVHVGASIGIAISQPGSNDADSLVRDAEVAMHRAKSNGRGRVELFDPLLRTQALERMEIESAMRAGLAAHQFVVHYQPEIEVRTNRIVGLEALVRWNGRGAPRSPDAFLPVAEETGLIVPLGESVLEQACGEAVRWHHRLGDVAPTVWVNVSARQLTSLELVPHVERAVSDLPRPSALGLEVTETDVVPDDEMSRRVMAALVDLGVKLAIDDFGTGFASLSYLWRFPAHVVKIDQSFVRRMIDDEDARVLVQAMIDMAHSLGKSIVAEGVETTEQLDLLRDLGADTVQGYLLARPQPASSIDQLLTV